MNQQTGFVHTRLYPTARVAAWLFCGFLGVVGLGFVLHAFWLSAAVAAALMVLSPPPVGRWLRARFTSTASGAVLQSLVLIGGMTLLIVVSEYEGGERRAEYNADRSGIIARAQTALENGDEERVMELVARYELVETTQLDRVEAALAERRKQEAASRSNKEEKSRREKKIDEMVDKAMKQSREESE